MENANEQILTPSEIAKMLKVTRSNITKLFHEGRFPNAFQLDKAIRIPMSDVEALKRQPFKQDA